MHYGGLCIVYVLQYTVGYVCDYKVLSQAVLLSLEVYRGNS